jgi:hypothetical protein
MEYHSNFEGHYSLNQHFFNQEDETMFSKLNDSPAMETPSCRFTFPASFLPGPKFQVSEDRLRE